MKRILIFILAMLCALTLVSCNEKRVDESNDLNSDEYYFTAKVTEVNGSSILVDVTDVGHSGLTLGSLVTFSTKTNLEVGDKIKVVFDGTIMESYPCQLSGVYSVTILDN